MDNAAIKRPDDLPGLDFGAGGESRTPGQRLTRTLLYLLSYAGNGHCPQYKPKSRHSRA